MTATIKSGEIWPDNNGVHINAHGGGVLYHDGVYYWHGEHKIEGEAGNCAHVGVHVYSSTDLVNWTDEGVALAVSDDPESPIVAGCKIERPKVIHCAATGKFVMWFHLELKDKGYEAAQAGVAVADSPVGPFTFLGASRPNGEMSRDMTLFVDDDGAAYHICSSDKNKTTMISRLSDDYLTPSGDVTTAFEGRYMEAAALCKRDGKYYFLASGCTGWAPNTARAAVADSIMGPWTETGNPCIGVNGALNMGPDLTFGGQSTHILKVADRNDVYLALFDIWRPKNAIDGRYVWLPIRFGDDGTMTIEWMDEWDLSVFD